MLDLTRHTIDKLNSLTKYPSIPTYHAMDGKGKLTDAIQVDFSDERVVLVTEKIDGTNARIVALSNGECLVGSRGEFLWYTADLLYGKDQGIVDTVRPYIECERLSAEYTDDGDLTVLYGEVYGGKVQNGKQYGGTQHFRVFDRSYLVEQKLTELLAMDPPQIAAWRETDTDRWVEDDGLRTVSLADCVEVVAGLGAWLGTDLPMGHEACLNWMQELLPHTASAIDTNEPGKAEGVVIRTPDRRKIAKLRFDDYRRALKG